jgi:hypothetical protein
MRFVDPNAKLTDRERILTSLVTHLYSTMVLCPKGNPFDKTSYNDSSFNYVHFAAYRKPVVGELVMGQTGSVSEWKIGYYVEPLNHTMGGAVIRDIVTGRLCNYSNETFIPIVGLSKTELLVGAEYQFYIKVIKAFRKGGEYRYRFGGVDINGDKATIWIRESFGGAFGSKPFSVEMEWSKKTNVKAILAAMRAGGYGTREFERDEKDKPKGDVALMAISS